MKTESQKEKEFNRVQDSLIKTKAKETNMKKFTINPQVKGAIKLSAALIVLGAVFYFGTQYQENYHYKITSEAKSLVTSLKPKQ